MRLSSTSLALALLLVPAALAAQTPGASRPPGCRGTQGSSSSVTLGGGPNTPGVVIPSYTTVESVQEGSPAQAAGMLPGDVVLMQNGRDLVGNPPTQPALAGDTVQLTVWRKGENVTLTVVLGRWDPPQEEPGVTRVCRRVDVPSGGED